MIILNGMCNHIWCWLHYNDTIMSAMASQITSLTIVYSPVYSGADQRKHQSSASLAFVSGIHRCPVNSPHKGPVTREVIPFDDVIMFPNGFQLWDIKHNQFNVCEVHTLSLAHGPCPVVFCCILVLIDWTLNTTGFFTGPGANQLSLQCK